MTKPVTTEPQSHYYLIIVHDKVPGRIRINVPGLYRNDKLRLNLESRLTVLDEIRLVRANTLTGNLLVEYKASNDSTEMPSGIAQLLEIELGCPIIRQTETIDRPAKKEKERKPKKARRRPEAVEYQAQPAQLWHTLTGARVIDFLQGNEDGLTQETVSKRLAKYGPNLLSEHVGRSSLQMFLQQFVSAPVAMLGLSAVISLATGGAAEAVVIVTVVMINSVIGFVTEKSAEKTINALGQLAPETSMVIRDGKKQEIPISEVTIGDIVVLVPGSYISADARLLDSHRLSLDESPLTGESLPVSKKSDYLGNDDTALGDRLNIVYMGTTVTGGNGLAIVVATGRHTEIGKIQDLVGTTKTPVMPMQTQIDEMGLQLALLSSGICALVFCRTSARPTAVGDVDVGYFPGGRCGSGRVADGGDNHACAWHQGDEEPESPDSQIACR